MTLAPDVRSDTAEPGDDGASPAEGLTSAGRPTPRWIVFAALGILSLPLIVALVALRRPTWFPVLDLAMTELRVRDVGGADTPLIGLPGRIGTLQEQGSHPGPLSFYLLAPTYRLLGSSAWALQAAAVVLNVVAMAVSLFIARRRGGVRTVLAVAAVLAVSTMAFGVSVLTEPWNPYMPLLWWIAFLLAAWSVAMGDWPMLPVAVFAATFCAQTHLPYLGLASMIGVGAVGLGALATRRDPEGRRRAIRSGAVAVGLAAVLWAPILVDQATNDPGNVTLLSEHMFDPPEEPVGTRTGVRVMLVHLDLGQLFDATEGGSGSLVDTSYDPLGSVVPGVILLLVWGSAVVVSLLRRYHDILRLHLVVGAGLALGVVSVSRVFGKLWYYLTLWAWSLSLLAVGATLWTVLRLIEHRRPDIRESSRRLSTAVLAVVVAISVGIFTFQAVDAEPPAPELSEGLGLVVEPTEAALRDGVGAATGADGRYVVGWNDALHIGSQGYGLLSELERRGLDVFGMPWAEAPLTEHRVIDQFEADAVVHFATGRFIDDWRAQPGAVEIVNVDPRTPAEQQEYADLRDAVIADLEAQGLDDVVPLVDGNVFGASLDPRLDDATIDRFARMLELGIPISVFVTAPGASVFP